MVSQMRVSRCAGAPGCVCQDGAAQCFLDVCGDHERHLRYPAGGGAVEDHLGHGAGEKREDGGGGDDERGRGGGGDGVCVGGEDEGAFE